MYKISFTSWENDGDDYRTLTLFLNSEADVDFYKALGDLFKSTNSSPQGMGNEEHAEETLQEILTDFLEDHPDLSEGVRDGWKQAIEDNAVYEKLCEEVLSDPVQYDYRFCRVVESTKIQSVESGAWLLVNKEKVVFITSNNDTVSYRIPVYPTKNGQVDVFSIEWQLKTCALSDIEYLSDSDHVSKKVAQLV